MAAEGSLIVRGGTLLHLDPPGTERADLLIRDGRVVQIGDVDFDEDAPVLDATGRWVMPGLVCGHTHLYSALSCGMPAPSREPTGFADMLSRVWWRLDRALDRDSVEVSALVGGVQALRAGVTTLIDHHASPSFIEGSLETIDDALGQLGLRRILCYEVSDRGGAEEAAAGIRAHEGLLHRDGGGRSAVLIGGHASFTLSDATLSRMIGMAKVAGVGLHLHVAESTDDQERTGEEIVRRLDRLGALLPGSVLAHCVHLDAEALHRVHEAGCWVSHQPRSNMNNAVGHAPLQHFGNETMLGTDGLGADMLAELQAGWFRGREAGVGWDPRRWLQALSATAHFAGGTLGAHLGRIEVGSAADLAILDRFPGPPLTATNLPAALIFRMNSNAVRDVVVDGRVVLHDREPVAVDTLELDIRAQGAARALWERMA